MAKKKKASKKVPAVPTPTPDPSPSVNKSKAIRAYLAKHEDQRPKAVAEALTEELGVEISSTLVSQIKGKLASKPSNASPALKRESAPAKPSSSTSMVDLSDLLAAKKLVDDLGGTAKAKEALNALGRLL